MKKYIILVLLILLAVFALFGCNDKSYTYDNADQYIVGGETLSAKEIDNIDVDWKNGKVKFVFQERHKVTIEEQTDTDNEDYKLRYLVSEGTLYIRFVANNIKNADIESLEKTLTISVPEDKKFENISVNTLSANTIGNIRTKKITVNSLSGNAEFENAYIEEKATLNNESGEINMSGYINGLEINTGSGSATINFTDTIIQNLTFNSTNADLDITLPSNYAGFKAKFVTESGQFTSEFQTTVYENINPNVYCYQTPYGNYKLTTLSGNVTLHKGA